MTIARRYDPDHFELVENTLRLRAAAIPSTAYVDGQDAATLAAALAADVHLTSSAPADVTKAAAAAGSATTAAKADHKHDVSTGTPGTTTPGASAAEGSATSLARSDHAHALAPFGTTAGTFCQGNDARILAAITSPLAAALDANGQRVENLPAPAADADPLRRIDRAWLQPVRLATQAALPSCVYSSTGNGTLTASVNGALPNIDGTAAQVGDRVLVLFEATGANNGFYVVTSLGSGGSKWVLTRTADAPHGAAIMTGMLVLVFAGSAGARAIATVSATGTVGTTAFTVALDVVRTPFVSDVDGNGKKITNAVFAGSTLGTTSGYLTYAGGTLVLGTSVGTNFTTDGVTTRYYLTADSLTITLDSAAVAATGYTIEFISTTGTLAPGHTFSASSGTITYAGAGGSPGSTAAWPSGAGSMVVTRIGAGWWRS